MASDEIPTNELRDVIETAEDAGLDLSAIDRSGRITFSRPSESQPKGDTSDVAQESLAKYD